MGIEFPFYKMQEFQTWVVVDGLSATKLSCS